MERCSAVCESVLDSTWHSKISHIVAESPLFRSAIRYKLAFQMVRSWKHRQKLMFVSHHNLHTNMDRNLPSFDCKIMSWGTIWSCPSSSPCYATILAAILKAGDKILIHIKMSGTHRRVASFTSAPKGIHTSTYYYDLCRHHWMSTSLQCTIAGSVSTSINNFALIYVDPDKIVWYYLDIGASPL